MVKKKRKQKKSRMEQCIGKNVVRKFNTFGMILPGYQEFLQWY